MRYRTLLSSKIEGALRALLAAAVTVALVVPAAAAEMLPGAQASHSAAESRGKRRTSIIHVAPGCPDTPDGDGSIDSPFLDLSLAVAEASRRSARTPHDSGVTALLAPGHYMIEPKPANEPTCGNCRDPQTPVEITFGLHLTGRGIHLIGAAGHTSVLHTNAGYGIWVKDCEGCVPKGIIGIADREGSRLEIRGNRILRNSWDGIALYRDAQAVIQNNVIDGVDPALGGSPGGGRGVGVGVTWNARANIRGNYIARYWKGVGVFVDAEAVIEENILEDLATWGLSLWDASVGAPAADVRRNVVSGTGACGVMLLRSANEPRPAGSLTDNAFVRTGQNPRYDSGEPYCRQTAVANHDVPSDFPILGNIFFANREPEDRPGSGDLDYAEFLDAITPLCSSLKGWVALAERAFMEEFWRRSGYDQAVPHGLQYPEEGHVWGRRP